MEDFTSRENITHFEHEWRYRSGVVPMLAAQAAHGVFQGPYEDLFRT